MLPTACVSSLCIHLDEGKPDHHSFLFPNVLTTFFCLLYSLLSQQLWTAHSCSTNKTAPQNVINRADCMQLAQNAVHGAMAGFTGFSVGLCNNRMVFLPIPELVATSPRSMNPHGRTWERVLALTRQPNTVPPKEKSQDVGASAGQGAGAAGMITPEPTLR